MQTHPCLHVRMKAIKLFGENLGVILHKFGLDKNFLDMVSNAQVIKEKIKWT